MPATSKASGIANSLSSADSCPRFVQLGPAAMMANAVSRAGPILRLLMP